MIGVAEHNFGARGLHRFRQHRLHRAGRADRHEGRRVDDSMRGMNLAAPRLAIGGEKLELATHLRHSNSEASP